MSESLKREIQELAVKFVQLTMKHMALEASHNNLVQEHLELMEEVNPIKNKNRQLEKKLGELLADNKVLRIQLEHNRQTIERMKDAGLTVEGKAGSHDEQPSS